MSIRIGIADTEELRQAVYRLRYDIYITEMKRSAHADHERKIITDWMDETGTIFFLEKNLEIIGTFRANYRKYGSIELEEEYGLNKLVPYFPNQISTTSKFMVRSDCRGKISTWSLLREMFQSLYRSALDEGIMLDFLNYNESLGVGSIYKKLGYRRYADAIIHPEFGQVVPMVLILHDIDHLRCVRSPYLPVAEQWLAQGNELRIAEARNLAMRIQKG